MGNRQTRETRRAIRRFRRELGEARILWTAAAAAALLVLLGLLAICGRALAAARPPEPMQKDAPCLGSRYSYLEVISVSGWHFETRTGRALRSCFFEVTDARGQTFIVAFPDAFYSYGVSEELQEFLAASPQSPCLLCGQPLGISAKLADGLLGAAGQPADRAALYAQYGRTYLCVADRPTPLPPEEAAFVLLLLAVCPFLLWFWVSRGLLRSLQKATQDGALPLVLQDWQAADKALCRYGLCLGRSFAYSIFTPFSPGDGTFFRYEDILFVEYGADARSPNSRLGAPLPSLFVIRLRDGRQFYFGRAKTPQETAALREQLFPILRQRGR